MKKKLIAICILITAIVISCVIFLVVRNKNINELVISGENYEDCIVEKYEKGFVTYNGTELIHYNFDMEQQWVVSINETDAKLSVNGKFVCIYSASSDKIYLVKEGKIVYNSRIDKELINAKVNENGYATVLTEDKGYKGQCLILSDRGKNIAKVSYGETYILWADLASDNKTLVMNVMEDKAEHEGKLIVHNIDNGASVKEIVSEEIYSYVNINNNKILASDGKTLFCYDKKGELKWQFEYGEDELEGIKCSDKYLTLILDSDEITAESKVTILNLSGRVKGIYSSDYAIDGFDASGGYTVLMCDEELVLINRKGHLIGSAKAEINTDEVLLFEKGKKVMTVSDIAVMKGFSK